MSDAWHVLFWITAPFAVLALAVALASKLIERRYPPAGRLLDVDGARLHVLERGSGDAVLFLHGNASLLNDFAISQPFRTISETNRCIAIDRPGYGYSTRPRDRIWTPATQADLIARALDALGCDRAVVVGHSWGVLPAIALAERHPHRVRSLVLLSGYYYPIPRADVAMAATGAIPVIGAILRYTLTPLLGLAIMPMFLKAVFSPAHIPEYFRRSFPWPMLLRPRQLRASLADGAMMTWAAAALAPSYRSVLCPTAILAGDGDRIVETARQSLPLASDLPDGSLETLPEVGHMIQHIAPDAVTRAIRRAALAPTRTATST